MNKLISMNLLLLLLFAVALPLVFWLSPKIPSRYGFWVSLGFYAIAAYLLTDFGIRSAGSGGLPESIDLLRVYKGGVQHTLTHLMWVLAINFCFAVAFMALLIQMKGFAAIPMMLWLMMAMLASVAVSISRMGIANILSIMTPPLWLALLFSTLTCICLQWHSMKIDN
jgi:hypothetical protein